MSETALTVQSPHLMPAMSMMEARSRFQSLVAFTSDIMREGVDYGTIPGTNKPTLLKPGAEKLTTFFGLSTRFDIIEKVEDWIGDQHGGEPFFYYWFRCEMRRGDLLIAEADGSCNSWESKYRYRTAERKCPKCGQTTIIKGKEQYGGGWLCWAKRGGCGAKFKNGDQAIEGQKLGRIPNPNPADIVNTIVKMAQKRALVATTLLAVNASEFYTQDMEDLAVEGDIIDVIPTKGPDWEATPEPSEPAQAPTTNGHKYDSKESRAQAMFQAVSERTASYYNAVKHMKNAIQLEAGAEDWDWPELDDEDGWAQGYNLALAHSKKDAG